MNESLGIFNTIYGLNLDLIELKKRLKVGDNVSVCNINGRITYIYHNFFVIQVKNYKLSFTYNKFFAL